MRLPLALLAATALPALVPTAATAADELKVNFALTMQPRLEYSKSEGSGGHDFNVASGVNGPADTVDGYLRFFRFGMRGSYGENWNFTAMARFDNAFRKDNSTSVTADPFLVFVERLFRQENGIIHSARVGLDYPFFNMGAQFNATNLVLTQRASAGSVFLPQRAPGAGYKLNAPNVHWGVDIQNNINDDSTANPDGKGEGLFYSTRVELTGIGWGDPIPKWVESWWGRSGSGYLLGLEVGYNQNDRTEVVSSANTRSADTLCYAADLGVHWNSLSVIAEARFAKKTTTADSGTSIADVKSKVYDVGVGWAFPGAVVLEPAIRYSYINNNTDQKENVSFGTSDFGASGTQIEFGLNAYFNGHANKLQLSFTHWESEIGVGKADILRLQHQIHF